MANIIQYIGAIISASRKSKETPKRVEADEPVHQIHLLTKGEYYENLAKGLCGCCGAPSGREEGICYTCRWS